jgi:parvulin-like peptidyl-prolyl isomerase
MRKQTVCVLVAALVVLFAGEELASPPTNVLATYEGGAVTFEDLKAYLDITKSTSAESDSLTSVREQLGNENSQVYDAVKNIAFYDLLEKKADTQSRAGVSNEAMSVSARFSLYAYARSLWAEALEKQIALTERDYEEGAKKYADQLRKPARAKVAYLFVENPEKFREAKAIFDEWRQKSDFDANFESYARKARDLKHTALTGGVIEDYAAGKYNPMLDQKVFNIQVGKLSDPFSTPKGTFIIKVIERHADDPLPAEEAREKLKDILVSVKLETLCASRLGELRKTYQPKEWSGDKLPPPETIIARVNDFHVSLKNFLEAFPKEADPMDNNPGYLSAIAREIVKGELIVQELLTDSRQGGDPLLKRKMRIYEQRSYALDLLRRMYERSATVTDEEARAYYEAHKNDYPGASPKRILALIFQAPPKEKVSSNVAREKILRELKPIAEEFAKTVTAESFEQDAKKAIAKTKSEYPPKLQTIGPLLDLPWGWQSTVQLHEMPLGTMSPVVSTEDAYIVFKVIEQQPRKPLLFEEVHDGLMNDLRAKKQEEIRQKLMRETLTSGNFRVASEKSS